MHHARSHVVALFFLILGPLLGQTPILMNAGYGTPTPIQVAPGQIITLYVSGTKTILPSQSPSIKATTVPLPASLGGFSVSLRQGNNSFTAPLISIAQTPNCTDDASSPQCIVTALTVQIPFEANPTFAPLQQNGHISINDNGTETGHFPASVVTDNIHILTVCDKLGTRELIPSPCSAIVTHADGTPVLGSSPVKAGETIVLYAYGFGPTTPAAKTGDVSPDSGAVLADAPNISVQFDFRPNAGPALPYITPIGTSRPPTLSPVVSPLFVGLTPGQVGLYQINVKIPDTIPSVPACSGVSSCASLARCIVQSNLSIDIGGLRSVDGAAICVQPQ